MKDPLNQPCSDFEAKVKSNVWEENLDEVIAFIKGATLHPRYEKDGNTLTPGSIDWSWVANNRCKYIQLRIDMRDGGFVLTDRDGQRINFEQLKWQYNHERDKDKA